MASKSLICLDEGLPAFPGALGFGRFSFGGSGRHFEIPTDASPQILHVRSLADNGANTLRAHLAENFPRIIVFDIGGIIALETPLSWSNPYWTIAGETAPGKGILIRNFGFENLSGADHGIARFLTIRPGSASHTFVANVNCTLVAGSAIITGGAGAFTNVLSNDYVQDFARYPWLFQNDDCDPLDPDAADGPALCTQVGALRIHKTSDIQVELIGGATPGDNVLLTGAFTLRFFRAAFSPATSPSSIDGIQIGANRTIWDHISVSWAQDECVSIGDPVSHCTIMNAIIAQGLNGAWHPEVAHSKGLMLQQGGPTGRVTAYNVFLAHNKDRNPRCGKASVEMMNVLAYNYGGPSEGFHCLGNSQVHAIRCYGVPGLDTAVGPTYVSIDTAGSNSLGKLFTKGCLGPGRETDDDTIDHWDITTANKSYRSLQPIFASPTPCYNIVKATDVEAIVFANAGDRPLTRNQLDQALIDQYNAGTGNWIDTEDDAGGYPPAGQYPTTNEDFVEPSDPFELSDTGYTNIEDTLHARALLLGAKP